MQKVLRGENYVERTEQLLGCSYEELVAHLTSLFQEGMTWENYGEWQVDHKRPLSSFDLTDPAQLAQAAHYTNLQPLWWSDNLSKGDSLTWTPKS